MISIYQLKPKFQSLLRPCANRLNNANITANQVTISACLGSIFVSFIVGLFSSYQWIFCVIPIWMLIRMALNAIDGMLAREIAFLIFVVELSDVLQYVFGKLFGKHPISPNLSPSKTIEGFIGGVFSASLVGACLWWITPFSFIQAGLISLMITLLGFLGGLVMSAIKRDKGVKDWGKLIDGHGGMLDRLDSVCFAAPIFFHIVRYYWV